MLLILIAAWAAIMMLFIAVCRTAAYGDDRSGRVPWIAKNSREDSGRGELEKLGRLPSACKPPPWG